MGSGFKSVIQLHGGNYCLLTRDSAHGICAYWDTLHPDEREECILDMHPICTSAGRRLRNIGFLRYLNVNGITLLILEQPLHSRPYTWALFESTPEFFGKTCMPYDCPVT